MTDLQTLIRAAIDGSGLSARRFAELIISRDERTVRRWVAGEVDIPPHARAWLARWVALPETDRATVVRILATEASREPWTEAREAELERTGEMVREVWVEPGVPMERHYRGVDPASGQRWEVVLVDERAGI